MFLARTVQYRGMWKGKLGLPLGHAHTPTQTLLRSNCPLPAFRANFMPPGLLPDSQSVLLAGNSACTHPEPAQLTGTGHIPIQLPYMHNG